ncbi:MAG TPA: hypothetical protein VHE30_21615 [Polyangiaceae bacterium]|nr:hypothetical protein [Polyangiaceae bacterium]
MRRVAFAALLLAACSSDETSSGNADRGDASAGGSSSSGGASSGGSGGSGGSIGGSGGPQGGGAGASSSGGASPGSDAGLSPGSVSCDPRAVLCRIATPNCPSMQVPSVNGSCYGPCVPVEACACQSADECPDQNQYTCLMSAKHCTPYLM